MANCYFLVAEHQHPLASIKIIQVGNTDITFHHFSLFYSEPKTYCFRKSYVSVCRTDLMALYSMSQPPSKKRTDGRTDRRRKSNLEHLGLKNVTSGGHNFNEFPDY